MLSNYCEKHLNFEESGVNSFDSLTLLLPLPTVEINPNAFYSCNEFATLYRLKEEYIVTGLNGLEVDTKDSKVIVTISSKLLADPLQLINSGSIGEVYSTLMALGAINCDYNRFLTSMVLRADLTADVHCTQISDVIKGLQAYASSAYRVTQPYRNRSSQYTSIEFHRQVKTQKNKLRVIVYDKGEEVRKNPTYPNQPVPENLLRVEANLRSFEAFRKYLQVESNTLENLMQSTHRGLYGIMQTITTKTVTDATTLNPSQLTVKELPYYLALQGVDWDLTIIRSMYRAIDRNNVSRLMKPYEKLAARRNSVQPHQLVNDLVQSLLN